MPKRVLDFDALWASDKIAALPGWAQAEYAWLYGLADASGSFELTNLRVIWGRVAAIRKDLTLERLEEIFQRFIEGGLLFTWQTGGKRYGHWTGSDVPGRLPPPSWRARLERLAPPVPRQELAAYMSRFSSRRDTVLNPEVEPPAHVPMQQQQCGVDEHTDTDRSGVAASNPGDGIEADSTQLKLGLERAQAQEWDRDWKKEKERQNTPASVSVSFSSTLSANESHDDKFAADTRAVRAEELLQIYEQERGSLPAAAGLTPERRRALRAEDSQRPEPGGFCGCGASRCGDAVPDRRRRARLASEF